MIHNEKLYYDEKGNVKMEIMYINGVPQNASQLEENQRKIFEMIEKNKEDHSCLRENH